MLAPLLTAVPAWATPNKNVAVGECDEIQRGGSKIERTEIISTSNGSVRAFASIESKRQASDSEGKSCRVRYELLVSEGGSSFHAVKVFLQNADWNVGAEIIGFSPDLSKLAADFWWAGGDYVGHRPVIYDLKRKRTDMRELGEQITRQLPSCDYSQDFIGVTNSGEAVIHAPKSEYVGQGCPESDWLFNLQTGRVRRLKLIETPEK